MTEGPADDSPQALRAWRKATRDALIAERLAQPQEARTRVRAAVSETVGRLLADSGNACIGFYWPIRAEIDLREAVAARIAAGGSAGLPAVVEPNRPVEFWAWGPQTAMTRGFWNIPVPEARVPVRPDILLVPLVGFDGAGFRLGYGGGYYDRTLAAMTPRPRTIGVGYELGRLPTIYPQDYDIAMDVVVTEAGVAERRTGS